MTLRACGMLSHHSNHKIQVAAWHSGGGGIFSRAFFFFSCSGDVCVCVCSLWMPGGGGEVGHHISQDTTFTEQTSQTKDE